MANLASRISLQNHRYICQNDPNTLQKEPYLTNKIYERCQEFYVQARASLLVHQEEASNSSSQATINTTPNATMHSHKNSLPRISLPKFSGEYQDWRPFHDLFSSMVVNNSELNSVEKMHYLKSCLSGEAFRLISNVPVSHDTFATAWEILIARYENKRFLISAYLDNLLNLKPIKTNQAHSLRSFLTTVTESLSALRSLDCQTHYWDPLLLHLLVRLLDIRTREAWEILLGSTNNYPTFTQFEEFLTCRTRALENLANSSSDKDRLLKPTPKIDRQIRVHVASSSENKFVCPLCKANHHVAGCGRYQSRSLNQRKELVAKSKLCYNCLGKHIINRCPSIQRCRKCGKKHHTSLHSDQTNGYSLPPRQPATLSSDVKREDPPSGSPSVMEQKKD